MDSQDPNSSPPANPPITAPKLSSNYTSHFTAAAQGYRANFIASIREGYKSEIATTKADIERRDREIRSQCEQAIKDLRDKALQDLAALKQQWTDLTSEIHQREREEIEDFERRFDEDPVAVIMRHEEVAVKGGHKGNVGLAVGENLAMMPAQRLAPQAQMVTPASTPGLTMATNIQPSLADPGFSVDRSDRYSQVWRPPPDSDDEDEQPAAPQRNGFSSNSGTGHPAFPSTSSGSLSQQSAASKKFKSKRPPLNADVQAPQPPRQTPLSPATLTSTQTTFLSTHLSLLKNNSYSRYFRHAVDPADYGGVPDYYTRIQKPMYITLLEYNLKHSKYRSLDEFMADFELMARNARAYNGEGHEVTQAAEVMEREFRRVLRGFPVEKKKAGERGEPIEID